MAIAASGRYGRALAYAIPGKAHHLGFGCFKARPRYQAIQSGRVRLPAQSAVQLTALLKYRDLTDHRAQLGASSLDVMTAPPTQAFFEEAVLLLKILNHFPLLTVGPTGEYQEEHL